MDSSEYPTVWVYGIQMVVTRLGGPFKYRRFWTINRLISVQFSDHHLTTRPFNNQTIWQQDTNLPFEYQTSPGLRWSLYGLNQREKIQWGSEIWTSLDFKLSKRSWVANGLDFKWNLKSGSPTIWNLDKWVPFCQKPFEIRTKMSGFWMVRFLNGWDYSYSHIHGTLFPVFKCKKSSDFK